MKNKLEEQVLRELSKKKAPKKRVTFAMSEDVKAALAKWCEDKGVSESAALEEMIKAVVPERYFK